MTTEFQSADDRTDTVAYLETMHRILPILASNPTVIPKPQTVYSRTVYFTVYPTRDYDAEPVDGDYPLKFPVLDHLRAIRRCFRGAQWEKIASEYQYGYVTDDWHGIRIRITTDREAVCTRVETGVETYTEDVPTVYETVTKSRPTYEWSCPE